MYSPLIRVAKYVAIIQGILFILIGIYCMIDSHRLQKYGTHTLGRVTALIKESHSNNEFPEFTYQVEGKDYKVKSTVGSYPPRYAIGDQAPLIYWPNNPEAAIEGSFINLWLFSSIFIALGILGLLAGIFIFGWLFKHKSINNPPAEAH